MLFTADCILQEVHSSLLVTTLNKLPLLLNCLVMAKTSCLPNAKQIHTMYTVYFCFWTLRWWILPGAIVTSTIAHVLMIVFENRPAPFPDLRSYAVDEHHHHGPSQPMEVIVHYFVTVTFENCWYWRTSPTEKYRNNLLHDRDNSSDTPCVLGLDLL